MVLRQTRLHYDRAGLSEKSEQAVEKLKDAVDAIVCNIKTTIASIASIATKYNISTALSDFS